MENITVSKDAILDKTTRERLSLERKIENSWHRYEMPRVKLEDIPVKNAYIFFYIFLRGSSNQSFLLSLLVRDMRCTK